MGGTGLEPVTPSLSSVSSLVFAQTAWLSGIRLATERLSERERTLILAILATPVTPSKWRAPSPFGTARPTDSNTSIFRPSSSITQGRHSHADWTP